MRASVRTVVAATVFATIGAAGLPAGAAGATATGHPAPGVRIVRDEYGVPHIYADSVRGLFFGQGWATGEERLWQADLIRRTATGRLAALIGPGAGNSNIGSDEFFRSYSGGAAYLGKLLSQLDQPSRAAVTGFVDGLNGEIAKAEHDGTLPLEYGAVQALPQPWTLQDVIASGMLSMLQVGATGSDELFNLSVLQDMVGRLGPVDGSKAFADSHWLDDPTAPTTIPGASPAAAATSAHVLALRSALKIDPTAAARARGLLAAAAARAGALGYGGPGHSNAIALSGRLTATGQPLLLGGPQIGHSLPQGFMELSLHGAGFDATGVTLAGVPGVLIGSGFDHAWTVTTGGDDNEDLYAETLDPTGHPGAYFYKGRWKSLSCRLESIDVAGGSAVPYQACDTVHGPVIGLSGNTAIAMRDATRNLVNDTLRGFFGMDRATSVGQFVAAAETVGGSLNLTYADSKGHIAYTHVGPVPIRPATDNRFLPHPGDGSDEWSGFLPKSQLPLVIDPAQGWLANWNNKPEAGWTNSSDGFWQWGPVQRVQAIRRQLEGLKPGTATVATLERINRVAGTTAQTPTGDDGSVPIPTLLRPLLTKVVPSADPRLPAVLALMRTWDQKQVDANNDGSYDSAALTVFNTWYATLLDSVVVPALGSPFAAGASDENTSANIVSRLVSGKKAGLPLQYDYLHGAPLPTAVTGSLVASLDALTTKFGTSMVADWLTPDATITWSSLGAGSVPNTPQMNRGTYNQILSLTSAGPVGENVVAPGESGDVRSSHFTDQLALYATWKYKPMRITTTDVEAHATSVEWLTP